MRKLLIPLLILLSTTVYADTCSGTFSRGSAAGGGSRTAIATMTFEDAACTDGSEWDAGGCGWTCVGEDGVFLVDDSDTIAPHGGTKQGLITNTVGVQNAYLPITTAGSGYIVLDYYIYFADISEITGGTGFEMTLRDGSGNELIAWHIWSNGGIGSYDGATYRAWAANGTIADSTWYHIEIEVNLDASDGANCYTAFLDGTEITANDAPYSVSTAGDPDDIARLYIDSCGGSVNTFIDDLYVYSGERP